jgi:hypothetical protein
MPNFLTNLLITLLDTLYLSAIFSCDIFLFMIKLISSSFVGGVGLLIVINLFSFFSIFFLYSSCSCSNLLNLLSVVIFSSLINNSGNLFLKLSKSL